jgi:hypothetical protein
VAFKLINRWAQHAALQKLRIIIQSSYADCTYCCIRNMDCRVQITERNADDKDRVDKGYTAEKHVFAVTVPRNINPLPPNNYLIT